MSFRFLVLAPLETQFPNPKKSPKLEENVFPPSSAGWLRGFMQTLQKREKLALLHTKSDDYMGGSI